MIMIQRRVPILLGRVTRSIEQIISDAILMWRAILLWNWQRSRKVIAGRWSRERQRTSWAYLRLFFKNNDIWCRRRWRERTRNLSYCLDCLLYQLWILLVSNMVRSYRRNLLEKPQYLNFICKIRREIYRIEVRKECRLYLIAIIE